MSILGSGLQRRQVDNVLAVYFIKESFPAYTLVSRQSISVIKVSEHIH